MSVTPFWEFVVAPRSTGPSVYRERRRSKDGKGWDVGIANSPVSVSGCRRARTSHPCLDWPSIVQDTCGEVGISGVGG